MSYRSPFKCIRSQCFLLTLLFVVAPCLFSSNAVPIDAIVPGGDWRDADGKIVAATEGGFLQVGDTFYLWGMDRSANNYTFEAVNLYKSTDLKNWSFVNKILTKKSHPDLDGGAVVERAKILHNTKTGQFVMWMHFEGMNPYKVAEVAYATSPSIGSPFTFQKHFRPLDLDSRDLNVYRDDDGKAYLICTTEGNQSVSLFELDDNYTGVVKEIYRGHASDDMECEGHAIIKKGGYYFWLMSWCSGWDFNENHYYYSSTLKGPWAKGGNIAVTNTHTYESQVGFALTIKGSSDTTFVFKGDRWSTNNYGMSRLVVLPMTVSGTSLKLPWHDQWNVDLKTGTSYPGCKNFMSGIYTITAKHSGMALGVATGSSDIEQQQPDGSENQRWKIENRGASHFRIISVASGKSFDVSGESREAGTNVLQYDWKDSYNQKWHVVECAGGYHRFVNVNTLGKTLAIKDGTKASGAAAVIDDFAWKDHQLFRIAMVNPSIVSGEKYRLVYVAKQEELTAPEQEIGYLAASGSIAPAVWKVTDLYNGYLLIVNYQTGLALDNKGASINMPVYTAPVDSSFSQQWQPVLVSGNSYKLYNRHSGMILSAEIITRGGYPMYSVQIPDSIDPDSPRGLWTFEKVDVVTGMNDGRYRLPVRTLCDGIHPHQGSLVDLRGRSIAAPEAAAKVKLPKGVYIMRGKVQGRRGMVVVE